MKKKKLIIASILGATALIAGASAVTIITSNAIKSKEVESSKLEESTLAEDELFGGELPSLIATKKVQKAQAPSAELVSPVIGRQYAYDEANGTVSIRFYAAITSLDVDAVWTRALYNADGSVNTALAAGTKKSTVAYETLKYKEGGVPKQLNATDVEAEDGTKPFKYFVLYTLKNVKVSTYGECTIDAYVEISNDAEAVVSKTGSVTTNSTASKSSYTLDLDMDNTYQGSNTSAGNGQYINGKVKTIYGKTEDFSSTYLYAQTNSKTVNVECSGFVKGQEGEQTIVVKGPKAAASYKVYVLAEDIAYTDTNGNYVVTVDQSYSGVIGAVDGVNGNMFNTISQALEFLQNSKFVTQTANKILNISAGYYHEKLEITTPNLTINGSGTLAKGTYASDENYDADDVAAATIIEFDTLYGVKDSNNFTHTTDSTQTVAVRESAFNCKINGVTVSNAWNCREYFDAKGVSNEHRALALLVQADQFVMNNSALLGYQDTLELFTGRQYFNNTYISGTTDFIFGTNNITLFNKCDIHSIDNGYSIGGYINAFKGCNNGASDYVKYGAVYYECDFTSDSNMQGKTALARPWDKYSSVAIIKCNLGGFISTDGYYGASSDQRYVSMNAEPTASTVKFVEYGNTGEGSIPTAVTGMSMLSDEEGAKFATLSSTIQEVFAKQNGALYYSLAWNPNSTEAVVDDRIVYSFKDDTSAYSTASSVYTFEGSIQSTAGTFGNISVDATNGKLYARGNDTQINAGTTMTFSVTAGTEVVISANNGDSITINGYTSPYKTFFRYFDADTTVTVKCIKNTYIHSLIINPNETNPNVYFHHITVEGYDTTEIKVGTDYSLPDSLIVKAYNNDNTYKFVNISDCTVTNNIVKNTAGNYEVSIVYNEEGTAYPVYYRDVDHITCSGGVVDAEVGDNLDISKLVVTAYLTDDDSNSYVVNSTDYTVNVTNPSNAAFDYANNAFDVAGNYTVTITHEGKTTSYTVVVEEAGTTKWTVTFVTEGSEVVAQSIMNNKKIDTTSITTTRDNYVFKGWFSDAEYNNAFNFDTAITEDITLYARFVKYADLTLENFTLYLDGTEGDGVNSFKALEIPNDKNDINYQGKTEDAPGIVYAMNVWGAKLQTRYDQASPEYDSQINASTYISFKVNAYATVKVTYRSNTSATLSMGEETLGTLTSAKSFSVTTDKAGIILLTQTANGFIQKIEVSYPTYIEENTNITFGSSGNYVSSALEIDGINTFNTNNSIITGTIKMYVKAGAKISIDAYGGGLSSYTVTANGATSSEQTDDYSVIVASDGVVVITGSSNNYLNGINVEYGLLNDTITFGTGSNYETYVTNKKINGTAKETQYPGYSQVKNGTISFLAQAGTTITITGYYSVDYSIKIGSDTTLVQGTDSASVTKTFDVTSASEVTITCQTGENEYGNGNYFTSIAISK